MSRFPLKRGNKLCSTELAAKSARHRLDIFCSLWYNKFVKIFTQFSPDEREAVKECGYNKSK